MAILATLLAEKTVGGGFGKADRVAVAQATGDGSFRVEEIDVGWREKHDQHADGLHHAMIAKFLQDKDVDTVVTGHMGEGMVRMLASMKIRVILAEGDLDDALAKAAQN